MLNYIWAFMIVVGVIYGAATGNIEQVGNGAIESAEDAVKMCITMLGIMSMWMGFMEIARRSGLIAKAEKGLNPAINWLFPNLPMEHKARPHIITNIIANILGLGWAATPAGLKAMEELSDLEEERRRKKQRAVAVGAASNEMCDFLILNISSLQLIPVNIIAFRTEYGSVTPTAIVGPAILATAISTGAAVLYIKTKNWMARPEKANNIFTKMVLKNEKASHIMGESK